MLKNDGRTVQFEVAFKEVSRNLLASDESLELTEPDSPLLVVFWRPLEEEVLNGIPAYRILKKVAEWVKVADPRLHRTLTWLQPRLRRNGVELTPNDTIQTMAGIDRLSGTRVELTYVDGVGVTTVKVLDGIKLPEEDWRPCAATPVRSSTISFFRQHGRMSATLGKCAPRTWPI